MMSGLTRFGDLAYVRFPGDHDFFFVTEPSLIRRVLVDDHAAFVKGRALQAGKRLLGEGLLTSEGADHLRRRRLIQPVFSRKRVDEYAGAIVDAAEATADRWSDRSPVDANAEMMNFALAVVGRTIFDADVESEAPEIRAVLDASMRVFHRFLIPGSELLWKAPLPATRAFNTSRAGIDRFIYGTIARRRTDPGDADDLLAHLLAARDPDDPHAGLGDTEIRDEAVTLMLAGHETTAQALTWTWYLLARNPGAEDRMRDEITRVLKGRRATAGVVDSLPYTRAVFMESLRMYPPVWAVARRTTGPYELGGFPMKAGGTVVMSQWVVHRDPRWFEEPDLFRPERWIDAPAPPPGAYFPFGGGPRLCIGERFAITEGVLALATLARRWRVVPDAIGPVTLDPRFTLRPRGGLPATTLGA
jgi:cytochrome P450